jgi:hypothetical protein
VVINPPYIFRPFPLVYHAASNWQALMQARMGILGGIGGSREDIAKESILLALYLVFDH